MKSTKETRANAAYWLGDGFGELEDLGPVTLPGQVPAWVGLRKRLREMDHDKLVSWILGREHVHQEIRDSLVLSRQQLKAYRECLEYYLGPHVLEPRWDNPTDYEFRNQEFSVERYAKGDTAQERRAARRQQHADERALQLLQEALGVLRRFIPTERGLELLEAVRDRELGVDSMKLAVVQLAAQLRNGSERLACGPARKCSKCGLPLVGQRRDARFCSDKCRMAARRRGHGSARVVRVRTTGRVP